LHNPSVFISYSHDSEEHKEWVRAFATDLRLNGVDVNLDQWDLRPGQDIVQFMHEGIARADRVLLICSERYVAKSDSGTGGVGYEKLIVSAEIAAKTDSAKFIPVVRDNALQQKIPTFMGSRFYLNFDSDVEYTKRLNDCLKELHGLPQREKPKLGAFAVLQLIESRAVETQSKSPPKLPTLSQREIEVLSWTLEGKTAWEVSVILGITERTTNFHLGNAIQKLETDNKHSAVIKAMRLGLIR
jgi:DNA-binding CsgD family transcriptional regulator